MCFRDTQGRSGKHKKLRLEAFRQEVAHLEPFLGDRVSELRDWSDVSLLTVAIDRLQEWARPGLLCIGDAAHAVSPIGGVGINLAIQDAVATANLLGEALRRGAQHPQSFNSPQSSETVLLGRWTALPIGC
jgi:2-polyprenyl-6-methoxyphenol hydroxylase-like FAD-dependent oxidoreductase